ncbi:TPA: lipase family protein [Proteus mirabilis]|nr:lipase family protein [Proteus mirabilis]HBC6354271.1 lipase family protein [Proteus mirabilis]HCD1074256.1 lipase family protein [Proteus mirabilis]HCD1101045.1 lipase family protein [Proteus mirabilis]HCD1122596.1 lipase family protein [Proteus mirabilis]
MTDKADCISCGKKWVEIYLVDEFNQPVFDIEYELFQVFGPMTEPRKGKVKSDGIIIEDELFDIPITLRLDTQSLIEKMSERKLRKLRGEDNSIVKSKAIEMNRSYRYTTIGPLCKDKIDIDNKEYQDKYPFYHFPEQEAFKGLTLSKLNTVYVIEICPFRVWSLILHHTEQYSMINAYNLGLLSQLIYNNDNLYDPNSVRNFFERQCFDLSRYPVVREKNIKAEYPAIVIDVPFDERYDKAIFLDTEDKVQHGSYAEGSTQLFYIQNKEQFIIAWRGSQEGTDWVDDFTYRSKDIKTHASEFKIDGKIHKGFLDAYQLGKKFFPERFSEMKKMSRERKLFICGHSLGGALALAHATELSVNKPLLYTYGAPRLFTISALKQLQKFTHYRHINNNDIVSRVPPEASLDNWLFNIYGIFGTILGGAISIVDLLGQKMITQYGEYYLHHGNPVIFYEVCNLIEYYDEKIPNATHTWHYSYFNDRNNKTKLYIVPEINKKILNKSFEKEKEFISNLSEEDKKAIFPEQKNPEGNGGTSVKDHYMGRGYLPFLHDQLLELIDHDKTPKRLKSRERFKVALENNTNIINPDLYRKKTLEAYRQRNLYFLDLQNSMGNSLIPMQENPKEVDMLQQFKEQTYEIFNQ